MRRFRIKNNISNKERDVRDLKDEIEICGEITLHITCDDNNDNIQGINRVYYDNKCCFFRKQYIDMFYDEINKKVEAEKPATE